MSCLSKQLSLGKRVILVNSKAIDKISCISISNITKNGPINIRTAPSSTKNQNCEEKTSSQLRLAENLQKIHSIRHTQPDSAPVTIEDSPKNFNINSDSHDNDIKTSTVSKLVRKLQIKKSLEKNLDKVFSYRHEDGRTFLNLLQSVDNISNPLSVSIDSSTIEEFLKTGNISKLSTDRYFGKKKNKKLFQKKEIFDYVYEISYSWFSRQANIGFNEDTKKTAVSLATVWHQNLQKTEYVQEKGRLVRKLNFYLE